MRWFILVIAIILNAGANMLIKMGMSGNREDTVMEMIKHRWLSLPIIGRIISLIFALVAYTYVLSKMKLNVAYPIMTKLGFVLIGISPWLFFRETERWSG